MSKHPSAGFSREFKLKAGERLEAGESAGALALELKINRTIIYHWRERIRGGGPEALQNRRGRPRKADGAAMMAMQGPSAKVRDLVQARPDRRAGAQGWPATVGPRFFQRGLAASGGVTPAEGRAWRDCVFAHIQAVTRSQGDRLGAGLSIERMCALAGVSRAAY
jgi:transposase-like protein